MRRAFLCSSTTFCSAGGGCVAAAVYAANRHVFSDKVRAGMILRVDKKFFRVTANSRSQKGQNAASYNVKLVEIGTGKKKEVTAAQGHDFQEVRAERARLLFSGFDDADYACFVFPEHAADAGKEVNIPGDSLPELQQKFLCTGMPVDLLHIMPEDDANDEEAKKGNSSSSSESNAKATQAGSDVWCEVMMPTSYNYTVDKLTLKGMYKMASFEECDGMVSVPEGVQVKDKIKISFRPDGTAIHAGKAA